MTRNSDFPIISSAEWRPSPLLEFKAITNKSIQVHSLAHSPNSDENQIIKTLWIRDKISVNPLSDFESPRIEYFRAGAVTTCIVYNADNPALIGQVRRYYKDKENPVLGERMALIKALKGGLIRKATSPTMKYTVRYVSNDRVTR